MTAWSEFFQIESIEKSDQQFRVRIKLNPDHEIYKGHFPGNPVVPGVTMVQIIKEILKEIYKKEFTMNQASQLKFLSIINPILVSEFDVELNILKEERSSITISGSFH